MLSQGRLLTAKEAAELLGVAERTLNRWRTVGVGPAFIRFDGRVRYTAADIEAFLKARKTVPEVAED